jgi:hypothetical protein
MIEKQEDFDWDAFVEESKKYKACAGIWIDKENDRIELLLGVRRGDQMVRLINHLNEKYCKKCGYYSKPRTYFKQTAKEDGTKETTEHVFENDELACKCEK